MIVLFDLNPPLPFAWRSGLSDELDDLLIAA
jgi:hypothetical protein